MLKIVLLVESFRPKNFFHTMYTKKDQKKGMLVVKVDLDTNKLSID